MMDLLQAIQGSGTVHRLGWALLHTLWLGAAAAALLAIAMVILRRRSANARYVAACAALALLAAAPVATFWAVPAPPRFEAGELPGPSEVTFLDASVPATPLPAGDAPSPAPAETCLPVTAPLLTRIRHALEPAVPWLVLVWAGGVCALSVWQLGGWIATERLKRLATRPARTDLVRIVARLARAVGVSRPVKVLESVLVKVPSAIGWLRPVILLPAGLATGLAPRQLEAILTHELVHVRRFDYLVNLLQSLIETLLFYHPAVWFISRRIRAERENCCDDMVVAAGAEPVSYAESLLRVAQRSAESGHPVPAAAVAATGRPSQLRTRIARLLGMGDQKTLRAVRSWPIALIFLAAVLAAGSVWISARAESVAQVPSIGREKLPTSAKAVEFRGSVLDTTGRPVSGARVTALGVLTYGGSRVELVRLGEEAVTGGEGEFRIPVAGDTKGSSGAILVARKSGRALGWAHEPGLRPKGEEMTIRLDDPATLGGVVVDEAGRPVAGALVRAYVFTGASQPIIGGKLVDELVARTDAKGRFVVRNLPVGSTAEFLVSAGGKAKHFTLRVPEGGLKRLQFKAGQKDVRIVVSPEARVQGQVTEKETGKPIGGARVVATPLDEQIGAGADKILSAFCVSGADGRFVLPGLRSGRYEIGLYREAPDAGEWVAIPVQVRTGAGSTEKVALHLTHGGMLEVAVRGKDGGKAMEKVYVSVVASDDGRRQGVRTDSDGLARFRLVPGQYSLAWVKAEGYKNVSGRTTAPGFAIAHGKTHRVEVALRGLHRIAGTVRDEAGAPVPGAVVRLYASSETAVTNAAGQFDLAEDAHASPGRERKTLLFIRHTNRNLGAVVEVAELTKPVAARLKPAAELVGRVVSPAGQPISGATVRLYLWSDGGGSSVGSRSVRTNKNGRYHIRAVPWWERYTVSVTADGYGQDYANVLRPDPGDGVGTVKRIVLQPADLSVSGTVVDEKGAPLPGARVWISGRGQPDREGKADESGRFTIDRVCAGDLLVHAQAGRVFHQVEARGGQKDVKVVLANGKPGRTRREPPRRPSGPKVGDVAPDFEVRTLAGKTVKLSDFRDRYVLLDFWATWCGPCLGETPHLKAVYKAFGKDGRLTVIGLSLDRDLGSPEKYVRKHDLKWIQGFLGDWSKSKVADQYGVQGIPHILLIGPDGRIVARRLRGGAILEAVAEAIGSDGPTSRSAATPPAGGH